MIIDADTTPRSFARELRWNRPTIGSRKVFDARTNSALGCSGAEIHIKEDFSW